MIGLPHGREKAIHGVGATTRRTNVEIPWTWVDLLRAIGLVVLVVLAGLAALLVARPLVQDSAQFAGLTLLGATNMIQVGMLMTVWLIAVRGRGASWHQLGLRRPSSWGLLGIVPLALIGAFTILIIYSIMIQRLGLFDLQPTSVPTFLLEDPVTLAGLIFLAIVVAPVVEELFFRGFAFPALRPQLGLWGAAAASALLFGLAHISLGLLLPTASLGLLLVYVYVRTGSLWSSILLHSSFNAINTLTLVLAV